MNNNDQFCREICNFSLNSLFVSLICCFLKYEKFSIMCLKETEEVEGDFILIYMFNYDSFFGVIFCA